MFKMWEYNTLLEEKQSTVLVAAESETIEEQEVSGKYSISKKVGFIKMKVIDSLKKADMADTVEELIEPGSELSTDGSNSYNDLHENYDHQPKVLKKKEISKHLPWVHIVISNAKRLLLNTHHRIDDDFLQSYLNEFTYKFNRRYFKNIFDRLLIASVSHKWNYLGG